MSEPIRRVLVLANVTSTAPALLAQIQRLAAEAPSRFTILVPAFVETSDRNLTWEENEVWHHAEARMQRAVAAVRALGLEVDGRVGVANPINAVQDLLLTEKVDLIVVSTLPEQRSRWLVLDLPDRLSRFTGLPILHVIAHLEPEPAPTA